ncbi:MAG: hypothetical protein V4439_04110 [Patescibacteria group bacterium]
MTWALRRQIIYLVIVIAFFSMLGFLIIYPHFNKAPTCLDGLQNGTETGIDCGGSCLKACTLQVDQISILWSKSFRVVPGRYNAVAYLENHNQNAVVNKLHYKFRFADKDNLYIGSREGDTYVPPSGKFAVFAPAIDVGNSIPVYTTFEFTEMPTWLQVSQDKIDQVKVSVDQISLQGENTSPGMSAVIKNDSLFRIPDMNVVVILYDVSGNAVSASSTTIDLLDRNQSQNVSFTWAEPFSAKIISKEVIPMYNIFSATLK